MPTCVQVGSKLLHCLSNRVRKNRRKLFNLSLVLRRQQTLDVAWFT